ncbi:MAG: hypothetical protein HY537_03815 [Deltaproteobacteria bacterium]|nr:hypothetical protein [Deltaproteobacteria bacterium]
MTKQLTLIFLLLAQTAFADENHYKSVLVGERATGMGGAYVAVSNDPSGIYYNPAGLVFSRENYLSLTANAYNTATLTFKDIVPGQDYTIRSKGIVPSFFGASYAFGKRRLAFAVVAPNADFLDQDDELNELSTQADRPRSLVRKISRQDTTFLAGPAYALALSDSLAVGLSLFAFARFDRGVATQLVTFNADNTGKEKYLFLDTYQSTDAYGISPKLGVQYKFSPELTVGLALSYTLNLGGKGKMRTIHSKTDASGLPTPKDGSLPNDVTITNLDDLTYKEPEIVVISTGIAYAFSKSFLISGQLDFYGTDSNYIEFGIQPTINWALGMEWYVDEYVPVRMGIFSNNANTPVIAPGATNQRPHVNLIGGSLGISYDKAPTSITIGTSYSTGKGDAQVITDSTNIQALQHSILGVYISGSYQL